MPSNELILLVEDNPDDVELTLRGLTKNRIGTEVVVARHGIEALDFLFAGFLQHAGLNMTKVPYRNPVEAANDLAEGRVQAYLSALAIVRPQIEAGKIKPLAVTNKVRAPTAPDVPTVKEAGYPDLTLDGLVGFFGPPEMSNALRERIAADIGAVVAADPTIGQRLSATGQIPNVGGPTGFAAASEEQRAQIAAIAKELGIKPTQ